MLCNIFVSVCLHYPNIINLIFFSIFMNGLMNAKYSSLAYLFTKSEQGQSSRFRFALENE